MLDKYLDYIANIRRYSSRTCEIYREVLESYMAFVGGEQIPDMQTVRSYEVFLMDDKRLGARSVSQQLSIISGYCKFLMREGVIGANPVRLVKRPKLEKKLPQFYRPKDMAGYFEQTKGTLEFGSYDAALRRMIMSLLFDTGLRRSELISLRRSSVNFARRTIRVRGKGDKIREIPITDSLCKEISLYLQKLSSLKYADDSEDAPLLQTAKGARLYPVFVDRAVKSELSAVLGLSAQKSPHILRHSIATELLDRGTDLNSIKELLGHSSLAATQVYTHNSIEKLKTVYNNAHPRAKIGGKNGD